MPDEVKDVKNVKEKDIKKLGSCWIEVLLRLFCKGEPL